MDSDTAVAYDRKWAIEYDHCINYFRFRKMDPFPSRENHALWCNATWDGMQCWPAIPAGTKYTMPCPSEPGFDIEKNVTKQCHFSGHWLGKVKGDFSRQQGFTEYSSCYSDAVEETPVDPLGVTAYVGFVLSIVAIIAIGILLIYSRSRRWRLNQVRLAFLLDLLPLYILRLCLTVDEELAADGGGMIYIHETACRAFISLLECLKLVSSGWILAICFHGLLETIREDLAEHCLCIVLYTTASLAYAIFGTIVWLCLLAFISPTQLNFACFGEYLSHVPSSLVLLYGNVVPLGLASLCAVIHAVYSVLMQLISKPSRFSGVRWLLQALVHLAICMCFASVWYYDLWFKSQYTPDDISQTHRIIETAVVAFSGFIVAILIGLAQLCLPAKDRMRL